MTDKHERNAPSLLRHLTAMLYDSLLVIALLFVVNGVALGVLVKLSGGDQEVVGPFLGQLLFIASLVGFYSTFWLTSGQTLGMQAWRVKMVSFDGDKPTLWQAVRRCVGAAISIACLGMGYWWRLFDSNQRYWHDYLSGTELVLLPKKEKNKKK